ncbi:MAG: glycosyltransferase family 39 protein [Anaerolineae bacterium]
MICRRLPSRTLSILAIAGVLTVAAALRLVSLTSVPPGLQHDEVFAVVFAEGVFGGNWPIFFDMNGGNEPLFLYLVTFAIAAFGHNVLALRLPAVAGGLLGVAATWWMLRRLFDTRTALLATLLMAVSLWHVLDSRVSLRAIWLPLALTLSYGFLWRWLDGQRLRSLVLGGILLGASLYTYTSAVLGLVTVAIFAIWLAAVSRQRWAALGLAGAVLLAALIGAPLAVHVASVPAANVRLRDLSAELQALRAGNPLPVLQNALKVAGMFAFVGDPEWRYNVAGRPVFSLPIGLLFYVGLFVVVSRCSQPRYAFLATWLVTNLGASAVTGSAPASLRAVGAAPAAYAIAAIGVVWIFESVRRFWNMSAAGASFLVARSSGSRYAWLLGVVLAAILFLEAADSIRSYFVIWSANEEVREVYRADIASVARYLRNVDWPGEVLMSAEFAGDLDRQSFEYLGFIHREIRWFDGQRALVSGVAPALVVLPRLRPLAPALQPILTGLGSQQLAKLPEFDSWLMSAGQDGGEPGLAYVATAWLANALRIERVMLPDVAQTGESLNVVVQWRVTAQAPGGHNITFFAHLRDSQGLLWSQADVLTYSTSDWRVGDRVFQLLSLPIPGDMPPGRATVQVGAYEDPAAPLTLFLQAEGLPFWRLEVGEVELRSGVALAVEDVKPELPLDVSLGSERRLVGASVQPRILQPGGEFETALWWVAKPGNSQNERLIYTLERDNNAAVLGEAMPLGGLILSDERVLRERSAWRVPRDIERGVWRLVLRSPDDAGFRVDLGEIFAAGVERMYELPTVQVPLNARFEAGLRLVGADVAQLQVSGDDRIGLSLIWQCNAVIDESYTVFVHLVGEDGRVVVGADSIPGGGGRPTTGWLPGEVIKDEHLLDLGGGVPAGRYKLVAGLYQADLPGYPRLPMTDGTNSVVISEIEVTG